MALLLSLAVSGPARAGIVSVTGNGNILIPNNTPNTGATANFFQDPGPNPPIHGWNEKQNVVLTKDVYVDLTSSGLYDNIADLGTFNQYKLAKGTAVSSHLLYFDPRETASVSQVTFKFDAKIIGVIVESDRFYNSTNGFTDYFVNSDDLGNPLTVYPGGHFNNRGLELGSPFDSISVAVAGDSVTIETFRASSPGDQVRVITEAVPEPTSLTLAGLGALALAGCRLRRRRA